MAASLARGVFQGLKKTKLGLSYCCTRSYAKKVAKVGKAAPASMQRTFLDPEKDPVKLSTYLCGGNINKEGPDPELKTDSEYPDWLWDLRLDRGAPALEDLDPDTSRYWRRIRVTEMKRQRALQKAKWRFGEM